MVANPLLAPSADRPVGVVFSGGGARGAYQVGVWEVLRAHGIGGDPQVACGTSSGAINAALIAAGRTPAEMLDFWLGLAADPPIVANERFFWSFGRALTKLLVRDPLRPLDQRRREWRVLRRIVRSFALRAPTGRSAALLQFVLTGRFDLVSELLDIIDTGFLFDTGPARERLRDALGGDWVPATDIALAINAVDVRTGRVVRFVNRPPFKRSPAAAAHYRQHDRISVDMVLASASIPLLFNPVRVDDDLLWDGGLLVNTPLAPAVALGAKRIVPVLATAGGIDAPAGLPSFGMAIERLADAFLENAYNVDRKMLLARNALSEAGGHPELQRVELYRAIRPGSIEIFNAGSYLYFERRAMRRMFEAGRRAALGWLARGPEPDDTSQD